MDFDSIQLQFPALSRRVNEQRIVYLDGPAGTQVPYQVMDTISDYYRHNNANTHGYFITSRETDVMMESSRQVVADFLNAPNSDTVSFGQNMTTLNFALSYALGKQFKAGDEILITELDHESNRAPWLRLEEQGVVVKEIKLNADGFLDYDDARNKISERTRLVAMGWAANITGTINDVQLMRKLTKEVNAYLLLDAVHYAAHFKVDVQSVDADFLLCSAYKFYGPHVGILYCKPGLLDSLDPYRLRTQTQNAPNRIETGTLNFAAIAGVQAAIQFIADYGKGTSLSQKLITAFEGIAECEFELGKQLYDGIQGIPDTHIFGPNFSSTLRAPTISFHHDGLSAQEICEKLARQNIQAWAGHFYAVKATEVTGLIEKGGVVRMGVSAYTTSADIDRTLSALKNILV